VKFKLDENLGSRSVQLFLRANQDVETVLQEGLSGASDDVIYEVWIREQRCLISLDSDFADVIRFPPHKTAGMAVLRLPKAASLSLLAIFLAEFLAMLAIKSIAGRLWIVEVGRIRVHESTQPNPPE
jgi:predicted nuclease of predicted toxin-antitoxin system